MSAVRVEHVDELGAYAEATAGCTRCRLAQGRTQVVFGAGNPQADLLFVYNARIETFRRDRFFKSDEVHAQCIAESVLLDVRTGIVVHTGHTTENISLKKTSADLNFSETVARAESVARGKAVVLLAQAVVQHLAGETK